MSNKQMILVVDDDPDCLDFARIVLSPHYEIRSRSRGSVQSNL